MALTDNDIASRRILYACCALSRLSAYLKAKKYGDTKCADNEKRLWIFMLWAKSIADNTPLSTEDFGKCVPAAFAEAVFRKADCYCDVCGCGPTTTPYPPVDPCIRLSTYSAIAAVDVDERVAIENLPPDVGDAYYIVTDSGGTWGSGVNWIQTWNGTGWDEVEVAAGEYVDIGGVLWTVTTDLIPGLADPTVTVTWVGPPDLYFLQSDYPIIAEASTRTVTIQVFGVGGWVPIFIGLESIIADPFPFNITGYQMDNIAVLYTTSAGCSYPAGGSIYPPDCGLPRDHDCADHDTSDHS